MSDLTVSLMQKLSQGEHQLLGFRGCRSTPILGQMNDRWQQVIQSLYLVLLVMACNLNVVGTQGISMDLNWDVFIVIVLWRTRKTISFHKGMSMADGVSDCTTSVLHGMQVGRLQRRLRRAAVKETCDEQGSLLLLMRECVKDYTKLPKRPLHPLLTFSC